MRDLFGWMGRDNEDRSDTAMSRIPWTVVIVFAVLIGGIVVALAASSDARADGPVFEVGTERTVTWAPVTTRADGRPVRGAVTYHVYAGSSAADMALVVEGATGTTAGGVPTAEGQNYVGVVAVEAGNTAGPSPMSALLPFEGRAPDSPPSPTRVLSVE